MGNQWRYNFGKISKYFRDSLLSVSVPYFFTFSNSKDAWMEDA